MSKILIVEDESDLAEQLKKALTRENYLAEIANDGGTAISVLSVSSYDLVVLDWMLPGRDGIDVCKWLRSKGQTTPILMLTARTTLDDKEKGLDSGADDYLTKPFQLREFLARVRALLRRGVATSNILEVGDLRLDPGSRKLSRGEAVIKLEPKEFNLLEFLMRNPNRVFSAEALVTRVWESTSEVSPDAIKTYIRGLRKKIDVEGQKSIITTVHGSGYRLDSL